MRDVEHERVLSDCCTRTQYEGTEPSLRDRYTRMHSNRQTRRRFLEENESLAKVGGGEHISVQYTDLQKKEKEKRTEGSK